MLSQPLNPHSPGYGSGVMEPGLQFEQDVLEPGWKVTRLANKGPAWALRSMLPASSLETWEDVLAKVDNRIEVDSAGRWFDSSNPDIDVSGPISTPIGYANTEEACENTGTVCKLFKPPPGSSDPLDPNDMCQV